MKTGDFDYELNPSRIAQAPLSRRDRSRLLLLSRADGGLRNHVFRELPELLGPGDLLVLNDTRVIPARFACRRPTGGRIDGLFLREVRTGRWEVLLRGAGRCKTGESLALSGTDAGRDVAITLVQRLEDGRWLVDVSPPLRALEILETAGRTPLPPYIHRDAGDEDAPDRRRYQTVYAARPGAVAAPTAGLHFTDELLNALTQRGVLICRITLHVGADTFLPVRTDNLAEHKMHSEVYELSAEAAEALNAARRRRGRIVAVGTTTVRVLETVAAGGGEYEPATGGTDIFIYPPFAFRAVDALITNFHLPRSTLLMLVAAFCAPGATDGVEMILTAYRHAVENGYRFYSYGDAMLIE